MKLELFLDKQHEQITSNRFLQLFTVFTRLILAVGFIPPSIKKILHQPFTVLPDSHPVGHYFNALYETGFYYEFIGWGQLIAALLLLFPRTAHIGALMFLPIITNIAVLTSSVGFVGTNYLTALMFLASVYLIAWDYDRLKPVLFAERNLTTVKFKFQTLIITAFFAVGGFFAALFFVTIKLANLHRAAFQTYIGLTIFGALFGLIVALHYKFMHVGELERNRESL